MSLNFKTRHLHVSYVCMCTYVHTFLTNLTNVLGIMIRFNVIPVHLHYQSINQSLKALSPFHEVACTHK